MVVCKGFSCDNEFYVCIALTFIESYVILDGLIIKTAEVLCILYNIVNILVKDTFLI